MFEFKDNEQYGLNFYDEAHKMILGLAPKNQEQLEETM